MDQRRCGRRGRAEGVAAFLPHRRGGIQEKLGVLGPERSVAVATCVKPDRRPRKRCTESSFLAAKSEPGIRARSLPEAPERWKALVHLREGRVPEEKHL